jgi:hypothetical protein
MATLTNYTKGYLGNLETGTGDKRVKIEHVAAYDRALDTAGLLVDLLTADQDGDSVKRRAVLDALALITGVGVTNRRLIAESLRTSLLAALGTDDWHEIAAEHGRRFMTDAPNEFLTRLDGDLIVLRQSLASDSEGARLAAPRLMMLHGMVTANQGDAANAARMYRAARIAADRSGDDALRQWVRGREAFRLGYEGASPRQVLVVASGVHDVEAYLAVSQAYARLGHGSTALENLDKARRVHENTDQSDTTIFAMPPWRMALSIAYVYALLGDVDRCERELATVAPPASVKRWEAQLEIQRAVAYAKGGDTVTGHAVARQVMRTSGEDQRSIVLLEMLREVKQAN